MQNQSIRTIPVSVIVPVFNGETTIRRCLESVLAQTVRPLDILVVNDGSTDGTAAVLGEFADRIRVLSQTNAGRSAARNAGLQEARGECAAFLDADDEYLPRHLEQLFERRTARPCEIVFDCFGEPYFTERDRIPEEPAVEEAYRHLANYQIWIPNAMVDLKWVRDRNIRFQPALYLAEDALFFWQMILLGARVQYVRERGTRIGVRPDHTTADPMRTLRETGKAYDHLDAFVRERGLSLRARERRAIRQGRRHAEVMSAMRRLQSAEGVRALALSPGLARLAFSPSTTRSVDRGRCLLGVAIAFCPLLRSSRTVMRAAFGFTVAAAIPRDRPPLRILVVGQTPPPYHGQAIAIQQFLGGSYRSIQLVHARMEFSRASEEVGRFRFHKLAVLLGLMVTIIARRIRCRTPVLYYPPAGPDRIPLMRDMILLGVVRRFFGKTVFHFHATGVSSLYERLGPAGRWFFRRAYFKPDLAICLSPLTTADAEFIRARRVVLVPNGVEDIAVGQASTPKSIPARLLYAGSLRETKGIGDLLEACRILKETGLEFELVLMGRFHTEEFAGEVARRIRGAGLEGKVKSPGELLDAAKNRVYAEASVFCFPTYYEAETFPLVLLEAMAAGLPIVATDWRGIPGIVRDGANGFLVPPRDPVALASRIGLLLREDQLRQDMGRTGRTMYKAQYTAERFRRNMEVALAALGQS